MTAQFTVLPGLSTNGDSAKTYTNNLSFNLFAGINGGVKGFELGSFVNVLNKDLEGMQVAGIANIVQGKSSALQVAGIVNYNKDTFQGIQVGGITNITEKDFTTTSYIFSLEGSFNGCLALLNKMENNATLGSIKHLNFTKKRNFKTNADQLFVEVIMQKNKGGSWDYMF